MAYAAPNYWEQLGLPFSHTYNIKAPVELLSFCWATHATNHCKTIITLMWISKFNIFTFIISMNFCKVCMKSWNNDIENRLSKLESQKLKITCNNCSFNNTLKLVSLWPKNVLPYLVICHNLLISLYCYISCPPSKTTKTGLLYYFPD